MDRIYLDYAAAAPLHPEVKKAMAAAEDAWANASSLHQEGRRARALVDQARLKIAEFFGAQTDEIIFTSGATESNVLALRGIVEASLLKGEKPHIVVSQTEHASIIEAVKQMEQKGVEITWLSVDARGLVAPSVLSAAIKENTVFVSIIFANNETGAVNDIAALVKSAKAVKRNVVFHTDAAQGVGWLDFRPAALGVDLMSVSSYKLGGPKGVGILYVKSGLILLPLFAGTQEWGKRAGTEPASLIMGMAKAIELSARWDREEVARLRGILLSGITEIDGARANTPLESSVPHIAHFSFEKIESQLLTIALDREGLAASPGSACSSGAVEVSHVVEAMGIDQQKYPGSLRLSLGVDTTKEQVSEAVERLKKVIAELRSRA